MSFHAFELGRGARQRISHVPPIEHPQNGLTVQASQFHPPHFPHQPLPTPKDPKPYRYNLNTLLTANDINQIKSQGVMVFHSVGDTGDHRGQQKRFVADMMTIDADNSTATRKPAFFYHLGDVVYFAGDIDMYGENFYAVYEDYPAFIVGIPGNHDCQPDDPQDGALDAHKEPFDGFVKNFMSKDPTILGSRKTSSNRTQMDLPNVYWTFNTPFATIIGLASNVSETEAYFDNDQIQWFKDELKAADPHLALIIAVHHPAFSGDQEHSGSSEAEHMLFTSFAESQRYPDLVLSGHVHNYQRFTKSASLGHTDFQIPFVVAGAGGFTNPKPVKPQVALPFNVSDGLQLDGCDFNRNYGFLRLEVSASEIIGTYRSASYSVGSQVAGDIVDKFRVDLTAKTVTTLPPH